MKLGVTLDILNQKDTPAFYADTLANRPAAGFTGRVFISTDTLDLYRDTGTTWVLLSPSSTGTITGSGAAGQVSYFSGASSIAGSNDLFFDSVNGHLGIGTITPSTALTIFHDQNQIIQINQTTATNDTKIAFQNSGTPLWRIGNSYNAGANDYAIYDVVGALQPLTIKKTTGQTFIGSQTTSSGLLVVNSSTADNQIVAIGANSPSIRVRNAGTSPTQQFGLGLSTATNNFIQGSASGNFCLFNGSTTASPMLLGIYDAGAGNVQEAARISAARNFLVNTSVDAGFRADINGTARVQGLITGTAGISISGGTSSVINGLGFTSGSVSSTGIGIYASNGMNFATDQNIANYYNFGFWFGFSQAGSWTNGSKTSINIGQGASTPNINNITYTSVNIVPTFNVNFFGRIGNIIRGIYYNPTITSFTNGVRNQLRGIETSIGGAYFNTTSVNDSAILQADSTTQGFLPPRMTTAEKNAIGTPATGLMVYDTTLNKLAVFTGVNWETVTSL